MIEKQLADNRLFDFLYRDTLPDGDQIVSFISASSDIALTFGVGAVNPAPIVYSDGDSHPIGTVIQIVISGGTIPTTATFVLGKVKIRFSTLRDTVVESIFDITLRA